ncbi:3-deoxy-manno-octulosonate cytidylyltransferase [Acuticoccus sp.]|uniref:3-deoxy-manno-octulosonate cytidylyltransferase n=1 Tax=Acuticoccus sp. TaxID=1904378 RepID=UPI003B52965F
MNPIVLIPARLGATRLPNKPLLTIGDAPLVVHVLRRAQEADVGRVVVACDGREVAAAVEQAGGEAVLTGEHPSGSDRIAEALARLDANGAHDVVVNVQGDLPTIAASAIRAALAPLERPEVDIATLAAVIADEHERTDPNVVKCVATGEGTVRRALYFTRATAPWGDGPLLHHIGLYAYRRAALTRFVALPPSALERRERLEQLRALEDGMRIDVAVVDDVPLGVDTPADLEAARRALGAMA